MQVVMASAWDFAPPSLAVMDEGSDDEEGQQPVTGGCASTPILGGWPALRMPQRWLVAALSLLFLYWMWSDDRADGKGARAPEVVSA